MRRHFYLPAIQFWGAAMTRCVLRGFFLGLFALNLTTHLRADEPPQPEVISQDLDGAAANLAERIAAKLGELAPSNPVERHRIAVARFNGENHTYSVNFGNLGPIFQTALADSLRTTLAGSPAAGRYTVPRPDTLKEEVISGLNRGLDPESLSDKNIAAARALLKSYNYQVGIVGRFLTKSLPTTEPLRVIATVITPETHFTETVVISPHDANGAGVTGKDDLPNKRLSVEVYVKHQPHLSDQATAAWKKLELQRIKSPELKNNFLLIVPRQFKGYRYKLVLRNNGTPSLGGIFTSNNDRDRMFLAAVMVDGVSAFLRDELNAQTGKIEYLPDTRHFSRLPKRILTPPQKYIREDRNNSNTRLNGGVLTNGGGSADHSVANILGFQRGRNVADAFVLGEAKDSVGAGLIGSINEIGLISVYFYPEYPLPGDTVELLVRDAPQAIGTQRGPQVQSPIFKVTVQNVGTAPVSIWHILYRYDNDPNLPDAEPFTQ
jgi:hypothetical protein